MNRHKKLEEGIELVKAQYNHAMRNMQNIDEETFVLEKSNIGNTLKSLTQEVKYNSNKLLNIIVKVNLLSAKNDAVVNQLETRPYYHAYDEIMKEVVIGYLGY